MRDWKITTLRGRPILLSLVWLHTELDSTQSYYHYLLLFLSETGLLVINTRFPTFVLHMKRPTP